MRHQASKDKPPTARPGYKIVQHGDHYREVPIAESKNAIPVPPTPKPAIPGLTYHAELLETNPVKSLETHGRRTRTLEQESYTTIPTR